MTDWGSATSAKALSIDDGCVVYVGEAGVGVDPIGLFADPAERSVGLDGEGL
jgi:hypothetical protein